MRPGKPFDVTPAIDAIAVCGVCHGGLVYDEVFGWMHIGGTSDCTDHTPHPASPSPAQA